MVNYSLVNSIRNRTKLQRENLRIWDEEPRFRGATSSAPPQMCAIIEAASIGAGCPLSPLAPRNTHAELRSFCFTTTIHDPICTSTRLMYSNLAS